MNIELSESIIKILEKIAIKNNTSLNNIIEELIHKYATDYIRAESIKIENRFYSHDIGTKS